MSFGIRKPSLYSTNIINKGRGTHLSSIPRVNGADIISQKGIAEGSGIIITDTGNDVVIATTAQPIFSAEATTVNDTPLTINMFDTTPETGFTKTALIIETTIVAAEVGGLGVSSLAAKSSFKNLSGPAIEIVAIEDFLGFKEINISARHVESGTFAAIEITGLPARTIQWRVVSSINKLNYN